MTEAVADARLARPALRRRTERRLVSGVAGGLADWLNASPFFVRTVVLLLILWEPAFWAYVAATVLLPARGRDRPGWDNLIGLARLGLIYGTNWLLGQQGPDPYVEAAAPIQVPFWAMLVLGLVVLLSADYVRGRPRTAAEERAAVLGGVPLAVSVALLASGIVLFDDVRWERFLPMCVLVAGAALLAGARAGRPRGFVAPAVVAVVLVGSMTAAGVRLEGGVSDARVTPSRIEGNALVVRRAEGDVVVDLRRTASKRPVVVRASVGVGDLRIALPGRSRAVVDVSVGNGEVSSNRVDRWGLGVEGSDRARRYGGRPLVGAQIRVIAEVGIGELTVHREGEFERGPVNP